MGLWDGALKMISQVFIPDATVTTLKFRLTSVNLFKVGSYNFC